jgi:MFS family permease
MAFVLLRAADAGIPVAAVPLVYTLYNLAYAGLAVPVGAYADRRGRRAPLLAAYLVYALVYALLARAATPALVVAAFVLLGLHSALLEVSERALVADLAGAERRGTAFGVYHTVVGLALLPASVAAGLLWDHFGAAATFGLGAACALLAAVLLVLLLPADAGAPSARVRAA